MQKYIFIDTTMWYKILRSSTQDIKLLQETIEGNKYTILSNCVLEDEILRRSYDWKKTKPNCNGDIKIESEGHYKKDKDCEPLFKAIEEARSKINEILNMKHDQKLEEIQKMIDLFINNTTKTFEESKIEQYITKAEIRNKVGNPPAINKEGHCGDPINWESLLDFFSSQKNFQLNFITEDRDFLDHKEWLLNEWNKKCEKNTLSFLNSKNDLMDLCQEGYKAKIMDLCNGLNNSPLFTATHSYIHKLSEISSFDKDHADMLLNALTCNFQVYAIREDTDIQSFYTMLYHQYSEEYSDLEWGDLERSYKLKTVSVLDPFADDPPF